MNLLANGSFEVNVSGWTAANCTRVVDAGEYRVGAQSCKITSSAAGDWGVIYYLAVTGTPVSRRAYTLSAWFKGEGAAIGRTIRMRLYEAGGAQGNTVIGEVSATLTGSWQRLVVTGTMVQADRTQIFLLPAVLSAAGAGEVFYLDGVRLEEVPHPAVRVGLLR